MWLIIAKRLKLSKRTGTVVSLLPPNSTACVLLRVIFTTNLVLYKVTVIGISGRVQVHQTWGRMLESQYWLYFGNTLEAQVEARIQIFDC